MSIDLTAIPRELATSVEQVQTFINAILEAQPDDVGFDTEASGLEYPEVEIAGFSLFSKPLQRSMYVPLAHPTGNLPFAELLPDLQRLADARTLVAHGWPTDGPIMIRMGLHLGNIACTLSLSNTLQAQNAGLKDQVLEYHLVDYRQVKTYKQVLIEGKGIHPAELEKAKDGDPIWAFNTIDVTKSPLSVEYACNDAIWCRYLLDTLVEEHDELVGNAEQAAFIRWSNDQTTALLSESAAEGYLADPAILQKYITDREAAIAQEEADLMQKIRIAMKWVNPDAPPPVPQEITGNLFADLS